MKSLTATSANSRTQRGVVIIFGLIALVIMLIGAVAMVRSMNSSLANAGNLGFKRDLTNQGERAMVEVLALMDGGALGTEVLRRNNSVARNYRATQFTGNEITAQGLPVALVDNTAFALVGTAAQDIVIADMGVMCATSSTACAATPAWPRPATARWPTAAYPTAPTPATR